MSDLKDILKLPLKERIIAVEAIWDSIAAENRDYPISEEELNALEERWAEYRKNPQGAKTWEQVKSSLGDKLK